jgi:hypothetical protein
VRLAPEWAVPTSHRLVVVTQDARRSRRQAFRCVLADDPPRLAAERIQSANRHFVQGRQLVSDGLLVLRKALRHSDDLNADDDGNGSAGERQHQNGTQH